MPNTPRGYTYPTSANVLRVWEDFQTLATTIDTDITNTFKKPLVRLEQATAQTGLLTATEYIMTFGTSSEIIDTHNFHSETTNNSRITPNVAGYYRLDLEVLFAFSSTITSANTFVRKNGSVVKRSGTIKPATTNVNTGLLPLSYMVSANGSGDYFELGFYFLASANQATNAVATTTSSFMAEWLRPL